MGPRHLLTLRPWRTVAVIAAALALTTAGGGAAFGHDSGHHSGHHHYTTCTGGTLTGTMGDLLVTGACTVPAAGTLVVNGDVLVKGSKAVFLSEFATGSHVVINGDVRTKDGGTFAMGTLNEGKGCDPTATSVVNGDVTARDPLTLKIDCTTVNGDLTSDGGGTGGWSSTCEEARTPTPLNFVVKDNTVAGDIELEHWQGCWMGVIRNTVGEDVALYHNTAGESDGMEVVTNIIGDDLSCYGNTPPPQVGDSMGLPNIVGGDKKGQCSAL